MKSLSSMCVAAALAGALAGVVAKSGYEHHSPNPVEAAAEQAAEEAALKNNLGIVEAWQTWNMCDQKQLIRGLTHDPNVLQSLSATDEECEDLLRRDAARVRSPLALRAAVMHVVINGHRIDPNGLAYSSRILTTWGAFCHTNLSADEEKLLNDRTVAAVLELPG